MKKPARFRERYYRIDARPGSEHPMNPPGLTELRTHGVSGGSPEDLVNDPHPMFVSGDDRAGFYRRLSEPETGPDRNIEAYSWSGLNSKESSRAFWLLLFPFAMCNHAGWMVGPKPGAHFRRALIRLTGLMLTIHYAVWTMVISVDLLAFQCGRAPACRNRFWLGWFRAILNLIGPSPIRRVVVFSAFPVLVIALLVFAGKEDPQGFERWPPGEPEEPDGPPLVDETQLRDPFFWQAPVSRQLQASAHGTAALAVVGATLAAVASRLAGPAGGLRALEVGLWLLAVLAILLDLGVASIRQRVEPRLLASAVRMAGVLTVLATVATGWLAWQAHPSPQAAAAPNLAALQASFDGVLIGELVLVMTFFVIDQIRIFVAIPVIGGALYWALSRPEAPGLPEAGSGPWILWVAAAAGAAGLSLAIYMVRNRLRPPPSKLPDPSRHLHNQFWIFFGLAAPAIATVLSVRDARGTGLRLLAAVLGIGVCAGYLLAASRIQITQCHDYPPRWRLRVGGPGALVAVGAIALTIMSAAVIVSVAKGLGDAYPIGPGSRMPAGSSQFPIGYYDELGWVAAAGVGALITFGLGLTMRIVCLGRYRFGPLGPELERSLAGVEGLTEAVRKRLPKRQASAQLYASLLDDLDWTVSVGVVAFMACSVSVLAGQLLGQSAQSLDRLVGVSSALLVGLALGLIWVVRTARKDSGARKAIGTLWEVSCFFPRRFQPLAPPSYTERAVPELRNRLLLLTEGGRQVLLVAHSQGTLLSAAVLESLLGEATRDRLKRIRFITYGCMLERSYGRSFPDLMRMSDLTELKAVLEGESLGTEFPPGKRVPRWMTFGRTTDFLGGRLFLAPHRPPGCRPEQDRPDDIFFDDPPRPRRFPGETAEPRMWRHSFNYLDGEEDRRFRDHVEATLREMTDLG